MLLNIEKCMYFVRMNEYCKCKSWFSAASKVFELMPVSIIKAIVCERCHKKEHFYSFEDHLWKHLQWLGGTLKSLSFPGLRKPWMKRSIPSDSATNTTDFVDKYWISKSGAPFHSTWHRVKSLLLWKLTVVPTNSMCGNKVWCSCPSKWTSSKNVGSIHSWYLSLSMKILCTWSFRKCPLNQECITLMEKFGDE